MAEHHPNQASDEQENGPDNGSGETHLPPPPLPPSPPRAPPPMATAQGQSSSPRSVRDGVKVLLVVALDWKGRC
jgi:hypothetical protein